MTITAAADGSSLGNPGPAGWAWYVDEDTWDAGGWPQGTNNLGELTAILRLLEATAETGEELHILADSQYAINVVSKWRLGWKKRGWTKADKKPIKNLELIQEIDRAMEGRRVTFEWVKGHAGHRMNERADDLARACAEAYQAGRTPEPGPGFGAARRAALRPRARRPGTLPPRPRPLNRTTLWSPARAHLLGRNPPRQPRPLRHPLYATRPQTSPPHRLSVRIPAFSPHPPRRANPPRRPRPRP